MVSGDGSFFPLDALSKGKRSFLPASPLNCLQIKAGCLGVFFPPKGASRWFQVNGPTVSPFSAVLPSGLEGPVQDFGHPAWLQSF